VTVTDAPRQPRPPRARKPRRSFRRSDEVVHGSAVGPPEIVDPSPAGWRPWAALAVIVAVAMFAVWAQFDRLESTSGFDTLPRIEVPSVSGLDMADAQHVLEDKSFVVNVRYQPNEDATKPKGMTFGQEPPPGSKVEQGDIVTIIVSDGPAGLLVPEVVGQQVADAQGVLASNGLRGAVTEVSDEVAPAGEVLRTEPDAGGRIGLDGVVTLTVSTGPAPRTVPPIVGEDLIASLVALGRSGLNIGDITRVYQAGQPENRVLETNPAPGTQLPRNMPVAITVTGPPPKATVPSIVGLSQSTAVSLLERAGLAAEPITRSVPAGDPQVGRVLSQNIPPFGQVGPGTTVQFVVGAAAAPPAPTTVAPAAPAN
jgi:beta-lactam-binding protein with PASTA domain